MKTVIMPKYRKQSQIKDIDFLPESIRAARKKRKKTVFYGLFGVLLAAVLYLLYTCPQNMIRKNERELAAENATISDLEKGKEVYERLKDKQNKKDTLLAALNEIEKQRFEALELMNKIGGALPGGVKISNLSMAPDKVSITVVSANPVDTARVIVALRKLDLFKEVELPGVPMQKEPKEVTFNLKFKEKPAGE